MMILPFISRHFARDASARYGHMPTSQHADYYYRSRDADAPDTRSGDYFDAAGARSRLRRIAIAAPRRAKMRDSLQLTSSGVASSKMRAAFSLLMLLATSFK